MLLLDRRPHLGVRLSRIQERPAFVRAINSYMSEGQAREMVHAGNQAWPEIAPLLG